MAEPRKTTKRAAGPADNAEEGSSEAAGAAAPPPAAPAPPAAAPAPAPVPAAPAAAAAPPPAAPAPPPAAPPSAQPAAAGPAPAAPAPDGPPPGAQVAAAISGVATTLKERLSGAELLLGSGALLILGLSYVIFGFLFDSRGPSEMAVTASAALLLLIGLERLKRRGFGAWYPVVLVIVGALLAFGAVYSFLNALRGGFAGQDLFDWLALLAWWVGGALAGIGSWMTFKSTA